MTDERQATLIEKIKKLFAMAQKKTNNDGTSNEAEAAAAMAKAQELLAKYNLDIKVIQDAAAPEKKAEVGGKREKVKLGRSAMYRWQRTFWAELAVANFCFHWIVDTHEERWGRTVRCKRHVILGTEANVAAVMVMGEYLCDVIERLAVEKYGKEMLGKSAISYREGCAERLIERIKDKLAKMEAEGVKDEAGATVCTALAVRDVKASEYAANYDAAYGAGAYARRLKAAADWEAGRALREKEYNEALELQRQQQAKETETQRRKRLEKEARERARWERRWAREQEREERRLDATAYYSGRHDANAINLNEQLKGR